MLPNEIFALGCRAWYEEQGLVIDASNGEFAHSPLTKRECDTGYYLLHGHHQHQGLLQSRDLDKCCFWVGDAKRWLMECDYFPENWFELWDIYEEYSSKSRKKGVETHRKAGTGVFDPAFRKKGTERSMEVTRKNGTGIFDPEVRKKATDKSMEINRNNRTGIFDPEVRNIGIERGLESQRKNRTGLSDPEVRKKAVEAASEARKKTILVTFLDGSKQHFKSIKEAAGFLGVTPRAVSQRLEKGPSSKKSKLATYGFELA